jgi:hypothetical protein
MEININDIVNVYYGNDTRKINITRIFNILIKKNDNIEISYFNKYNRDKYKKLYINLKDKKKYEFNENDSFIIKNDIITFKNYEKKNIIVNKSIDKKNNIKKFINNKYDYILSTNVRDEDNIIEFIMYHLLIGFDYIYIIDHLSKKPVSKIISRLPEKYKNKIKVLRFIQEGSFKMHFLNDIILPFMREKCNKYFIHLDGDEYINLNNNYNNINELLEDMNNPDILTLNWLFYGSNNKDYNDNKYKCLIPTFTKCSNNIYNHFKAIISKNVLNKNINFINPHQILIKNDKIEYTNVENKKFILEMKKNNLFEESKLTKSIKETKAFINHYNIQSKEDYLKRKINRNRDDISIKRIFDEGMLSQDNDITYNNLLPYYDKIIKLLYNNFGFMIIRYVIDERTDKLWQLCYDSIRKFYNNKIIIIDDHSDLKYLTKDKKLYNCEIINSEFKGRGELLPYYYYLKNPFCERLVVLHDSMIIKEKINFNNINNYKNFTRLFSFHSAAYNIDIKYFKNFCDNIQNGDNIYKYHLDNKHKLIGCFGVCYIIDYDFLDMIEKKYKITNLINIIDTRDKRKTLERFFSCLFEYEYDSTKCRDLLGSIFSTIRNMKNNNSVKIEKFFSGR